MAAPQYFSDLNRADKRFTRRKVEKARASGNWGEWHEVPMPIGMQGQKGAFLYLSHKAYQNDLFTVLVGEQDGIIHLGVSLVTDEEPSWRELQRIKNHFAGEDKQAVQIYPPEAEVTDRINMYHLWVFPFKLPVRLG